MDVNRWSKATRSTEVSARATRQVRRGPAGRGDARSIVGQTSGGRYLRVIAARNPAEGSILVGTAYELSPRQLAAYRRRRRKKRPW